ncbi:sarcosine oxidase subunit gamma [Asanoa ishikariensis]|uniref:Sarcosine oxidase subunit gamma n=1 Tax=Asanoa ishikariensis TaxID=137265 RepID=A0A1H3TEU4_9ACTN|nr:sarcosine oxidase subunit gamma family protein [Asanoa ishikariensis]GIF62560.1 sarcosine oxidase subunit gamma [Asanoa ishikariensis]SDZ48764.1 sarcosine oxidase subunit gamma [Asanoa ishikariensis]
MADPRRSPLAHLAEPLAATGIMRELPYLSSFEVRGDPAEPAMARLGAALFPGPLLAASWPTAGHAAGTGPRYALWCGPGWYLLVDEPGSALAEAMADDLPGVSAVDVSAGRTVVELSGPHAREVLAHGCALDLHPRVFGPGSCARTNLAKAQVILHQTASTTYRVFVGASFADYLARWLLDAAVEYIRGEPVDQ